MNDHTIVHADLVLTPSRRLRPGWLLIQDGRVADVGSGAVSVDPSVARSARVTRLPTGATVVPGFVDMHSHGAGGGNMTSPEPGELALARRFLLRSGVTSTVASLVTASEPELTQSLSMIAAQPTDGVVDGRTVGARLVGVHLEGPYLAESFRGSHWRHDLRLPDRGLTARLLAAGEGNVRMMTYAPELPGAAELATQLRDAGVVCAVGHTGATAEQTTYAIDRGARVGTHLFNGMRAVHHREPGPVMTLLADDRVVVELINDGVHVHPQIVKVIARAAGAERLALISDGVAATGAPDGDYLLGRTRIRQHDGRVETADGSSLGGGVITLDGALRRLVCDLKVPLEQAVASVTSTPARALGIDDRVGSLDVGRAADLCVLDADCRVTAVMVGGQWVDGVLS